VDEDFEILGKEFACLGERMGLANYVDDEDRAGEGVPRSMQGSKASSDTKSPAKGALKPETSFPASSPIRVTIL
jgi:hypothetical protein